VKVTPYKDSSASKKVQVARMFNNIAWRYDFLNHFLSFGIDRYWRWKIISELKKYNPKLILDVATGTADQAIAALKLNPVKIYGIDISPDMLAIGKRKLKQKKLNHIIELFEADSENLFFEANKFDAVTVSFGVRNFENLEKGLKEIYRVLKQGGVTAILEFSKPRNRIIQLMYNFYSTKICPGIGRLVSKDKAAYEYLHESVEAFPTGNDFVNILKQSAFSKVKSMPLTFGIVTIYLAEK
jgi:demethylmenaquinone methyltransferase / 2-methoxy-6-polyprenyl-1,4-benzoquinol methylase